MTEEQVLAVTRRARELSAKNGKPISALQTVLLIKMIEYAQQKSPHREDLRIELSFTEMAETFGDPRPTVVSAIKALESAGLITRTAKKEGDVRHTGGVVTEINGEVLPDALRD